MGVIDLILSFATATSSPTGIARILSTIPRSHASSTALYEDCRVWLESSRSYSVSFFRASIEPKGLLLTVSERRRPGVVESTPAPASEAPAAAFAVHNPSCRRRRRRQLLPHRCSPSNPTPHATPCSLPCLTLLHAEDDEEAATWARFLAFCCSDNIDKRLPSLCVLSALTCVRCSIIAPLRPLYTHIQFRMKLNMYGSLINAYEIERHAHAHTRTRTGRERGCRLSSAALSSLPLSLSLSAISSPLEVLEDTLVYKL